MVTTRLIAMHKAKTGTLSNSIRKRIDYVMNPDKTDNGELISTYQCNKETVSEEFLLTKNEYFCKTGRTQQSDIIAYQIRQAFKPGEITPEKANEVGFELAMRFTKGKYAFIVCTHIDRAHIHNHIVFNSTSLDATRKYLNFWLCGLALQRVSDLICLENGLSVISNKVFVSRNKKDIYKNKESFREIICKDIDSSIMKKPSSLDEFFTDMEKLGYEVKRGKNIALKGKKQKRFIRLDSLDEGYKQEDIIEKINEIPSYKSHDKLNLLIDIQNKMMNKGEAYERWATNYNIKSMAKTLLYLRDDHIESIEQLEDSVEHAKERFNDLYIRKQVIVKGSMKKIESRSCYIKQRKKRLINMI